MDKNLLVQYIKDQAIEFGFLECTISKAQISQEAQSKFNNWIANNYNGSMDYLANNREVRFNPALIHDGTISIICVKLPYLHHPIRYHKERLSDENLGYISSYALGRDYHKVNKKLLNELAKKINQYLGKNNLEHQYRVFTDSAPIMEIEIAKNSGLGWRGKNTLLLDKNHGSMFFLGEIFTNLDLSADEPITEHCGSCKKCIDVCPTKAFISPYTLDARRCISYLTIENNGPIPVELRKLIGNRVYGCDDCQLFCPWNKFSKLSSQIDFNTRNNLDSSSLLELFGYSEEEFHQRMQGSPIYRIGYDSWLRNIAVGIGNSPYTKENINALEDKLIQINNEMIKEHILWALSEQVAKSTNQL